MLKVKTMTERHIKLLGYTFFTGHLDQDQRKLMEQKLKDHDLWEEAFMTAARLQLRGVLSETAEDYFLTILENDNKLIDLYELKQKEIENKTRLKKITFDC